MECNCQRNLKFAVNPEKERYLNVLISQNNSVERLTVAKIIGHKLSEKTNIVNVCDNSTEEKRPCLYWSRFYLRFVVGIQSTVRRYLV